MEEKIVCEKGTHPDVLSRVDDFAQAPIVFSNILARILIEMLGTGLADTVSPAGILILGGILNTQTEAVIQAAQTAALSHIDTLTDEDWVVLVFQKA